MKKQQQQQHRLKILKWKKNQMHAQNMQSSFICMFTYFVVHTGVLFYVVSVELITLN